MRRDIQVAIAGIGLLVLGAFGPWVTVTGFSESGLDSDGVITLGLAVIAAVFVFRAVRAQSAPSRVALGACGLLSLVISIIDVADVSGADLGVAGIEPSVGWGLWLTLIGSIVLTAAAALAISAGSESRG